MNGGKISPEQALVHLLDVLPVGGDHVLRAELDGALARTRRQLVRRMGLEMNRLVAEVCEEVAANCGLLPRQFFAFAHPDCSERQCRGSQIELLRLDRVVGGEISCLCRAVARTRLRPLSLQALRIIPLSGRMEDESGDLESGRAITLTGGKEVLLMPEATFLVPTPVASYLIRDAVLSGFRVGLPGRRSVRRLQLVSSACREGCAAEPITGEAGQGRAGWDRVEEWP